MVSSARSLALGLMLALALTLGAQAGLQPTCANPPKPTNLLLGKVTRVVDGDTIHVQPANGRPSERVRLLGIDTPEVHESAKLERNAQRSGQSKAAIQALGRLAWDFTRKRLDGKNVELEFDVQLRDRYGRVLAGVWGPDGVLFNMVIVREGYAQVMTVPPNVKYADLFLACQREAREKRRGLWGQWRGGHTALT